MKTYADLSRKAFLVCLGIALTSASHAAPDAPRRLTWLENNGCSPVMGTTLGVPWPQGMLPAGTPLALRADDGSDIPIQSWPLATWPDGSLKWTGVAMGPREAASAHFELIPTTEASAPAQPLRVQESEDEIRIATGAMEARIARTGNALLPAVSRNGRETLINGRLVALNQNQSGDIAETPLLVQAFESRIDAIEVEQRGPVRAVVRIEGRHAGKDRAFLPFIVRLYFYAGSDNIRMVHTFIYDADEHRDFIRGLGVRFDVPMTDAPYDRHVRFAGADGGLWSEAVQGITGLRRDPGEAVRRAQVDGRALPDPATWDPRVSGRLAYIPRWNDYRLVQPNADGFQIEKRTAQGHAWIRSAGGTRASGAGYVGGVSGGVAFGMRDFWQSHPSQIDIRGAAGERAETTLWLWAPDAPPMDLRFYHDGMSMTNRPLQGRGLEITYEDYAEKLGTPQGVARTSEINLWIVSATPDRDALLAFAHDAMRPPMLATAPAQILESKVFGGLWTLPDRSTPTLARIEDMLDHALEQYLEQREVHRWYGFWDYGDVMHSFDGDRNVWKYDIGGFAWANSELSPDIWLWTQFLRSGRADVFRFAEAMARHTGEVDVYHVGPMAGFGTRHNVQHWGDGMKQLRISTPIYRRYYYYLTADERVGDLMRAQVDAYLNYRHFDAFAKAVVDRGAILDLKAFPLGLGTDLSAVAAAWFIEWERTGDPALRDKLVAMMTSIGKLPYGFLTADVRLNTFTGEYVATPPHAPVRNMSHLASIFGWPELNAELLTLFDIPEYRQAWTAYCAAYNADRETRRKLTGVDARTGNLRTYYSRFTAFAAHEGDDPELADRAWREILGTPESPAGAFTSRTRRVEGAAGLHPFAVGRFMSTNWASEWNNAMLQCLRWIGDRLPEDDPRTRAPQPAAESTPNP